MQQLTPHVYGILKFFKFMNCYLVVNGDTITVVDTGIGSNFVDAIEVGVKSLGKTLDHVRYAFITHCHFDHVGGLAELQQRAPHMQTYAHRLDAPVIRGEQENTFPDPATLPFADRLTQRFIPKANTKPARVDVELEDGAKLDFILAGAQAVHLPGHSLGQIGLWLSEERTLIGGDVMGKIALRLGFPVRAPSPDWNAVKASIRKVSQMNVANLCLGHGAPDIGNGAAQVQRVVARL